MLVEDAMFEWKENEAPFTKLRPFIFQSKALIPLNRTNFVKISFTPWHALPEHKPLGAINRMRKIIYENISRVRHDINSAPRQEPKN